LGISPAVGSAIENTPVVITGENFVETPSVKLGETWLISVTQVSSTTLNAVVPGGITPGTYDLSLYNGDCQPVELLGAFSIDVPISGLIAESDSPTLIGETTSFTATVAAGTNVVFTWDFGDGSDLGHGSNVTHTYTVPGTYIVIVTASNASGSQQVTLEVIVNAFLTRMIYMPLLLSK
jgi:uncharacterized membrane protein